MAIIDASVAVKFVVEEPGSETASLLLSSDETLVAPDWVMIEVANALWRKVKEGALSQAAAVEATRDLPQFFQRLHASLDLLPAANDLAFLLDHWLYDCLYLEAALRDDDQVITTDRKFRNAARRAGYGERVVLLKDYRG